MERPVGCVAVFALFLGGCDPLCVDALETEAGQIGFFDPYAEGLPAPFASGDAVVVGSTFCPDVQQWYEGEDRTCVPLDVEPEEWFEPCWDKSLSGPATQGDHGCLEFTNPGSVRWELTPRACEVGVELPDFGRDRVVFEVVPPNALGAKALWWFEERAEALQSPGPAMRFPSDWIDPPEAEVRLVANGPFVPMLGLFDLGSGAPVGFSDGVVAVETLEGEPTVGMAASGTELALDPGDRVRLDLQLPDARVAGPVISGVAESEISTLELVAAYHLEGGEDPWGAPIGVRALARDDEGRILRVPLVDWSAQGDALVELAWHDVVLLSTPCSEPEAGPGSANGIVTASIAGLTESIDLEWTTPVCEESPPDPFNPDPEFDLDLWSCSCRSDGGGRTGAFLMFAVLLGLRRRRGASR